MHLASLIGRSLAYHWRAHTAVALGVLAGTAALTGALLVGDALRGSLRAAALDRLGHVDFTLTAPRYFRSALADDLSRSPRRSVCPAILARAAAQHSGTHVRAARVQVLGVDARFWQLGGAPAPAGSHAGRVVYLNAPLANDLRAKPGDDVLLRLAKPAAVSTETLLGRRDDTTTTLRLTVAGVLPAEGFGAFNLYPNQAAPRNAFVPLPTLQRALGQDGRANELLVAAPGDAAAHLAADLRQHWQLGDLGLRLRAAEACGYVALESDTFVLAPAVEEAARAAAHDLGLSRSGTLAYLANAIEIEGRPGAVIPYSTVAAVESAEALLHLLPEPGPPLATGELLLNQWAADELHAVPGETVRLSYYVVAPGGELRTETARFRLRGVVPLAGPAADPGFTPTYPGVTDAASVADWKPPFPIDLKLIRDRDEAYWQQHGTTPKAFVSLTDGQRLWATHADRLGRLTALRLSPPSGVSAAELGARFEPVLLARLDPAEVGFVFDPVRQRALDASAGTTDFGALFLGFSEFLIVAAALLITLLFRLGVERRAREIGLFLAVGFTPRRVAGLLLAEGGLVAGVGTLGGLAAARGYAWLMLAGLRTWWAGAVNAPFLQLHDTPGSYIIGAAVSFAVALLSIVVALRGLTRLPARGLLAGVFQAGRRSPRPARRTRLIIGLLLAVAVGSTAVVVAFTTNALSRSVAFFVGGTALLVASLLAVAAWLRGEPRGIVRRGGLFAALRLGVRNARRHVGRSVLTVGLLAGATFVIVALQAMRLTVPADVTARGAGTGGFALLAEAAAPLPYDLNTPAGRDALRLSPGASVQLADVTVQPFRVRDGDDASCLNLYRPGQPRLLGAPDSMTARGGFTFAATLANTEAERANPWRLLQRRTADGTVPVIADEAAALWQLHLSLGDTLVVPDERGQPARLRIVALLRGSILQGELIMAERPFLRLFPSVAGPAFFLIDAPRAKAAEVETLLERELAGFGVAVSPTRQRLAELLVVQNTYLSTFQLLGGLGLLLGTLGLAAVLLRNVNERRSELALLRAVGFSHAALAALVVAENALLMLLGVGTGLLAALVVLMPHVAGRGAAVPWGSVLAMLVGVLLAGLLAGAVATWVALRARLLPALRAE